MMIELPLWAFIFCLITAEVAGYCLGYFSDIKAKKKLYREIRRESYEMFMKEIRNANDHSSRTQ